MLCLQLQDGWKAPVPVVPCMCCFGEGLSRWVRGDVGAGPQDQARWGWYLPEEGGQAGRSAQLEPRMQFPKGILRGNNIAALIFPESFVIHTVLLYTSCHMTPKTPWGRKAGGYCYSSENRGPESYRQKMGETQLF